jgi:type I restriction enzyme S subunit
VQIKIAEVLGALDELIVTNRGVYDEVLALSRSEYSHLVHQVTELKRLGDVIAVNREQAKLAGTGVIRYADISALGDGVVGWSDAMEWAEAPSRARRKASRGDTLWSGVRPNLRAHGLLIDHPANLVVSTGIVTLTPVRVGPAFLFGTVDDDKFIEMLSRLADGGAYPAVRPEVFSNAEIPWPTEGARNAFEDRMWPLWEAASELAEEARTLETVRDELLPLLMSGKVLPGEVSL